MSNGTEVDAYAKQMAALKRDWPKLTAAQRQARMQDAVNDAAKSADFPAPKITMVPLSGNEQGHLEFSTWSLAINNKLGTAKTISDRDFAELSDTIYHEERHAEQWWLIARRDAASGMTPAQIMTQRGIANPAIAKAAVKQPLKEGQARRECADAMYNSVYGKGATARNNTLTQLPTDQTAEQAAATKAQVSNAQYNAVLANPASTAAQKSAALNKAQTDYNAYTAARTKATASYLRYRRLPEEADAWDSGSRAGKAVSTALKHKGK